MRILVVILSCFFWVPLASAEKELHKSHQANSSTADTRILVVYPPEVKAYAFANMRRHLEALAEIMVAFSNAQYGQAADIADNKLGVDSNGATACRVHGDHSMPMLPISEGGHVEHHMAKLMPEGWWGLGQNMHVSANEFANKARDAAKNGGADITLASVALAKITQQCVACHSSYRMQ